MKYSFKNNYAIVTGATGLIGPSHTEALASIGYNVIIIDLDKKKLISLKNKIKKKFKKVKVLFFCCDITSEKEVIDLKIKLSKDKIKIDCLVNNADLNPKIIANQKIKDSKIENYSLSRLKSEINVGILGTFNCCKIFGEDMAKNNNGKIINISSDLGIIAPDHRIYDKNENIKHLKTFKPISYTISKHAIHGITKYISTYWGHRNVRCNTLVLGSVLNKQPKYLIANIKKRVPLMRLANKKDYIKSIQFLASDQNSYMTGQTLIVDGGRTIW